jgi:drug/metabolite transporter (DMT)-like permease
LIGTAFLFFLIVLQGKWIQKRDLDWRFLLPTAVFMMALPYGLVFWGEQYVSAGLGAILNGTIPFFTALFALSLLPQERLSLRKAVGLVLGFAGVVVIFWDQAGAFRQSHFWGKIALLGSAVSYGLANVWVRRHAETYDTQKAVFLQMLLGTVMLLGLAALSERSAAWSWSMPGLIALLYLAIVGSALAFAAFFWLLKRVEATKASLIAFVTPVVALFLGWAVLGETVTIRVAVGSCLVLAGILTVTLAR